MREVIERHPDLTVPQLQAIVALLGGATFTAAAETAGIDRSTLYEWRQNDTTFRTALVDAKYALIATELDRLQRLSAFALDNLESILTNPNTSLATQLRASLAVLNRLKGTGHEGWATPHAIPEAQYREREARHLAVMKDALDRGDHQIPPKPPTTKEITEAIAQLGREAANPDLGFPQKAPEFPNFSEFQPPHPIRSTKIGRNEPCPCNSGLKYKKCCLNKPLAMAA